MALEMRANLTKDNDGIFDSIDNCIVVANPDQKIPIPMELVMRVIIVSTTIHDKAM